MVLSRRCSLWLAWGLVAGLWACATAPARPRAPAGTALTVGVVQDGREPRAAPPALRRALEEALSARGIEVRWAGRRGWLPELGRVRATSARLAALAAGAQTEAVLLVEVAPSFYSQMNGRYRWSVGLRATWAPKGDLARSVWRDAEFAAHLRYDHEREEAAVTAVAGRAAALVGGLLDDVLVRPPAADGDDAAAPQEPRQARRRAPGLRAAKEGAPRSGEADGLLYFVLVDRFADGDPTNDGAVDPTDPAAWHGGDLAGVRAHLDWIAGLGARWLWLSPLYAGASEAVDGHGAFHGYWVYDHFAMNPRFGTFEDLAALVRDARARGIRVLLDVVVNHVAYDAPLVQAHPEYFHRRGPIVDWDDPVERTEGQVHGLPDLDQSRPEVYRLLLDSTVRWVERSGAAGVRLDAVRHVPLAWWARFNADLAMHFGEDFVRLGEDLDGNAEHLARTMAEGGFTHLFDFPLYFALVDVLCKGAHPGRLGAVLSLDRLYPDPNRLVTLLDNHDLPRIASVCGESRVSDALALLFGLRGIPSITWGTEVGLRGMGEPENRGDMVFERTPLYRKIASLAQRRRKSPALRRGATRIHSLGPTHLAWLRWAEGEAYVISLNTGTAPLHLEVQGHRVEAPPGVHWTPLPITPAPIAPARVRFALRGEVPVDGRLVVVGAGPELGSWDPTEAPTLGTEPVWVEVPGASVLEFKLAVERPDGQVEFEPGPNRYYFAPPGESEVVIAWGGRA
ncbi:MAG: hypothetical protein D6729_09385 [Deltaproteobacteria bacterium]|nr:MAG: hypothetical protein D6729_09385 [Deltaproteobacteria bacterium]